MSPALLDTLLQAGRAIEARRNADDLVEAFHYGRATAQEVRLGLSLALVECKKAMEAFGGLYVECERTAATVKDAEAA